MLKRVRSLPLLLPGAALAMVLATLVGVPSPARAASQATPEASVAGRNDLLDINTATAAQLMMLPGVGKEYARRIIAGRPYTAKNQLVSRGVLPQPAYDEIAARIIAHRTK